MWFTLIEIGLKLAGFIFGSMSSKKERMEWLAKASETLHKKGLVRSKFLIELEADREDYLEKRMRKMQDDRSATNDTTKE